MAGVRITQQWPHALPGRRYGSFADRQAGPSEPPLTPGATLLWQLKYEESGLILTGTCRAAAGTVLAAGYGVADVFASDKNPNQLRFYRSTDDGRTWALATTIAQSRFTYRMYGWSNGVALLGTQNGLCRSTDDGVSWAFSTPAGWSFQDPAGFYEPGDGNVYTWYWKQLWRSADQGATWTLHATLPNSSLPEKEDEDTWITDFVVGADGSWLLATGTNGSTNSVFSTGAPASIWRSEDDGATWEEIALPHTYADVDPEDGWGPPIVSKEDYWTPPSSSPEAYGYYGVWDTSAIITQFARLEWFTGVERIEHLGSGIIAAIGSVPMMDARGVKSPPRTWRSSDNGKAGTWEEVTNQVFHTYDNDHTYQAGALRAYGTADVVAGWWINAFQSAGGLQNVEDEIWTRESHDAGLRYPTTGTYDTPQEYEAIFPTEIILSHADGLVQTLYRTHETFWVTDVCRYRWKSQIWRAIKAAPGRPALPPLGPCPPAFLPTFCPQECVPGDAQHPARSCARMS